MDVLLQCCAFRIILLRLKQGSNSEGTTSNSICECAGLEGNPVWRLRPYAV